MQRRAIEYLISYVYGGERRERTNGYWDVLVL